MASAEELYDAEREAYYAYLRVATGADLVTGQRVSPVKAKRAYDAWLAALVARDAVCSPEEIRGILARRAAEEVRSRG